MTALNNNSLPTISVIIPCYNHGHFLPEAIKSVLLQSYQRVEIIVVDDGSTDNTAEVAAFFPEVQYVFQENQGLSASRNAGVAKSRGDFLVFLDADDWLYPNALETNLRHLSDNREAAFVSGAYDNVFEEEKKIKEEVNVVISDHYEQLLNRNYIGMIASVMYRRWIFEEFLYDVSLRACEDYDLYFKITRKYPVVHHSVKIAGYRLYSSNMSSNIPLMLNSVRRVMKRQRGKLRTTAEKQAYQRGIKIWEVYYSTSLYEDLAARKIASTIENVLLLLRFRPSLALNFIFHHMLKPLLPFNNLKNKK